ncbi:hypothetical protein Val02_10590 [Virgisporangium aliadipatigenens]|uniref:Lipoprotein n=1 Tax=Virgisporangium aliadipatigenens TaxID=741659 RepID=A0A8J4DP23_9ACTN|nr:hypothetical protein [Virgisporangium aliadipatigenens]GIJ44173.1 hypothetical protein Val02_10590 [Virgisporangium aliadipatigenens]
MPGREVLTLTLAAALVCGAAAGCSGEDTSKLTVRLLVRDINLRAEGVDCAGTGPYQHVHNRSAFTVLDGAGKRLASGELPPGRSVGTFEEDLGVEKVPTYCEFAVPVEVADRAAYRLVVEGKAPIDLKKDAGNLVAVVP